MEFFGFTNSDLVSPIGLLIRGATDSLLLGPDWSKIMDICDIINADPPETAYQASRVIARRLQESDQTIVQLTLVLAEACMKNCGIKFASTIDRSFMDEIVGVARGNKGVKNSEEALRIIQEWGRDYETQRSNLPLFFDTYVTLKSRGLRFPPESSSTGIGSLTNNIPLSGSVIVDNSDPVLSQFKPTNQVEFSRLENDLDIVFDRVRLCREMLLESPGISNDEALAEVIGFLEACRDRMTDLIEAGTHGLLGEDIFALTLKANDAILKTLEAERTGTRIGVDEGLILKDSNGNKTSTIEVDSLLDFGVSPTNVAPSSSKAQTGVQATVLTADEDDEFGSLTLKKVSKSNGSSQTRTPIKPIPQPNSKSSPKPTTEPVTNLSVPKNSGESDNLLDFGDDSTITPLAELHSQVPVGKILNSKSSSSPSSVAAANNSKQPNEAEFDDFLNSLK